MKIILVILIIISFSSPLCAGPWGGLSQGMSDGITKGLQNAQQMQQIQIMEEQRRLLEQQRLMLEQQQLEQQQRYNTEQNVKQTNNYEFIRYMNESVPDWRTIDQNPAFIKWLDNPVPYTSYTKLQLLRAYVAQGNAPMVAQFFIDYKATLQSPRAVTDNTISNTSRNDCEKSCVSMYERKELKPGWDSLQNCFRILCR